MASSRPWFRDFFSDAKSLVFMRVSAGRKFRASARDVARGELGGAEARTSQRVVVELLT